MISIIVSADDNWLIGKSDGSMPWQIPEEAAWFKQATMGSSIVMGRKTWESLPEKPLQDRYNVVVSKSMPCEEHKDYAVVPSVEFALGIAWVKSKHWPRSFDQIFIIGGAQIYKYALEMDMVNEILVSRIRGKYEGDIHFPRLDGLHWMRTPFKQFDKFEVIKYMKV